MEIGKQIKLLRTRRGVTQEELAERLGVTAQAVSKWEREAASPDISLLPELSVFFGVTIDELFALSDEARMERIQNMLWDVRCLNPAEVAASRDFLLDKAGREPENGKPYCLLADVENHLAKAARERAAEYARQAMEREPENVDAKAELVNAMGGCYWDWTYYNHNALIRVLQEHLAAHPNDRKGYMFLFDQLADDFRFDEAEQALDAIQTLEEDFRVPLLRGQLAWLRGDRAGAHAIWSQGEREYPGNWNLPAAQGDYAAWEGRYEEAIGHFRRARQNDEHHWSDTYEGIAQLYELLGDNRAAIAEYEAELENLRTTWDCVAGSETYDQVAREVERLKRNLSE